jgi:hypothetical protein
MTEFKAVCISSASFPPRTGDGYLQLFGEPDEIGERGGRHLSHDIAAMDLEVIWLMASSAAACLLRRPLTTRGSTSRSRGVSE